MKIMKDHPQNPWIAAALRGSQCLVGNAMSCQGDDGFPLLLMRCPQSGGLQKTPSLAFLIFTASLRA